MKTNLNFALFILFVYLLQGCCCGTVVTKCGNGNPVSFPKCPEKAYAPIVKTFEVGLKGAVDILGKVKLNDLDASVKTKVTELREKFNQYSGRTEAILKTSYLTYCGNPCDPNISKAHQELLKQIAEESNAIEVLNIELKKAVGEGNIAGVDQAKLKTAINKFQSIDKGDKFLLP